MIFKGKQRLSSLSPLKKLARQRGDDPGITCNTWLAIIHASCLM